MDIDDVTRMIHDRGGTVIQLPGPGLPLYTIEWEGMTHGPMIEREVLDFWEGL